MNNKNTLSELSRLTALKLAMPEDVIHKVISYHWESIAKASSTHNSLEITGLAKMEVRTNKVSGMYKRYKQVLEKFKENRLKRPSTFIDDSIQRLEDTLAYLKTKNNNGFEDTVEENATNTTASS